MRSRGLSPNTLLAYAADVGRFVEWLGAKAPTKKAVGTWTASLSEHGEAPSTVARRLVSVSRFLGWLVDEGELAANPAAGVKPPKKPKRLPKPLATETIVRILDGLVGAEPADVRDRAMLELAWGSGLRISELLSLRVRDVTREWIRVVGKGDKERTIPTTDAAWEAWSTHVAGKSSDERAFAVTRQTADGILRRRAAAAGVEDVVSFHRLRHSFATALVDGGADLVAVSKLMGHASVTTTAGYVGVSDKRMLDVCKVHPRNGGGR